MPDGIITSTRERFPSRCLLAARYSAPGSAPDSPRSRPWCLRKKYFTAPAQAVHVLLLLSITQAFFMGLQFYDVKWWCCNMHLWRRPDLVGVADLVPRFRIAVTVGHAVVAGIFIVTSIISCIWSVWVRMQMTEEGVSIRTEHVVKVSTDRILEMEM
ncbi:hypothetical protein F4813DRAFT_375836 [Daldinia decipiens]|uniref:uncharacterized protein n=1 Tax=Daldinia decipiens TaxID=326647 RepID=UPI0020C36495|nr:uncharacterized protein F4813DRAFT_375836 [Daldinia decipiens]KAI1653104.1 hypothetical protein F4813DRAFT_375836 [Daldinia decipiens]